MPPRPDALLDRWLRAGLLDPAAAERIRVFEAEHAARAGLRWPAWIAIALGALALGAGVLLFVAAHWDTLAPGTRFALVLALVAVFHLAGVALADRLPPLAMAAHALGTIALGAGIYLAGQIFHLQAHWPAGLLLWALGAWAGWLLLREWPQGLLAALLTPAWLAGEWTEAAGRASGAGVPIVAGLLLLALTYLAADGERADFAGLRRALVWAGAVAVLPLGIILPMVVHAAPPILHPLPAALAATGWLGAIGGPLAVAVLLRGRDAAPLIAAALWVGWAGTLEVLPDVVTYLWAAIGAVGLVAWGLRDGHATRVNLGTAGFALALLAFYFSEVMDRLGRSMSLVGLGVLLLAGGSLLERARRRFVVQARERSA